MLCLITTNVIKTHCQFKSGKSLLRLLCTRPEKLINNAEPVSFRTATFGQPTSATHPHLVERGELLPGLKTEEFRQRRHSFMELIFKDVLATYGKPVHTVVIVPSSTKVYMTEQIPYVYHQNTDYLYLSGCLEPDTALLLSGSCKEDLVITLLLRNQNTHSLIWDGPRTSTDVAPQMFGVDQAFFLSDLSDLLKINAQKYPNHLLYYDMQNPSNLSTHSVVTNHIQQHNIMLCRSCKNFNDRLRVTKSVSEQNLMRQAVKISSMAIRKAMETTKPGISEHQLFATVDYESRMRGAEILAYLPVVASGKNTNIIHYTNNNQITKDGDLILMDAGCEYRGYCGDITRTWPVNGKFTTYQRILYEIVLDVQKQIVNLCQERLSLDHMYQKMVNLLGEHLRNEKILKSNIHDAYELNEVANELCPHHVSHYLGMDVHDVRTVPKSIALHTGMVITVEPGLYTKEHKSIRPEFWNLGIRIEDDVLITDTGYEILSADCPKEVLEIENIMTK